MLIAKLGMENARKIGGLVWSVEICMRSFLINKNLSPYFWLRARIGKEWAFRVANTVEKIILVFGRERVWQTTVAYEFYVNDDIEEFHLLGILPERRKDPLRITYESIMNWGRLIAGDSIDINKIHFIRIEI